LRLDSASTKTGSIATSGTSPRHAVISQQYNYPASCVAARKESWMSTVSPQVQEESQSIVPVLLGITAPDEHAGGPAALQGSRGNREGSYLSGAGRPLYRLASELQGERGKAAAQAARARGAADRARREATEQKRNHRGGNRAWPLRLLVPFGIMAEAVTAYVGIEVLVNSRSLAIGLSALIAVVGGVLACILANRRLNLLGIPVIARILEGTFVAVLTVLRYESLSVQGTGYMAAAAAASLAALISALGLLGIEEIVVETHSFIIFASTLWASWKSWRGACAAARCSAIDAAAEVAADKLRRHYLEHLLKMEEFPLDQARQSAAALWAAVTDNEGRT
jgi:hypothetical protein